MRDCEYVVYKEHDGTFRVAHDYWFDDPTFRLDGQRVDTREEIARYKDMLDAFSLSHLYNQMVHGTPRPTGGQR